MLEEAVERVEIVAQATLYFRPEVTEAMEAVAKVARAFPKMLSALENIRQIEEYVRGRPCLCGEPGCVQCLAINALRAAREALGPAAPPQRCTDTVTEWTDTEERTVPCNHPLPCPLHAPRAAREAVKP